MRVFQRGSGSRWWPPAAVCSAVAVAVVAGTVLPSVAGPGGTPRLPLRTSAQVLALLASPTGPGYSGSVHEQADLGLPALPASANAGLFRVTELLAGSHTLQVWSAPGGRLRVAVLDRLAETDVVLAGSDLTTYDSATGALTHLQLPDLTALTGTAADLTPAALAQRALRALDPGTAVSTGPPVRIAGRPAYDLVLTPRTTQTLVDRVEVAVDAGTGQVLRAQVFARGQHHPALAAGFTTLDRHTPAAAHFALAVPAAGRAGDASGLVAGVAGLALGALRNGGPGSVVRGSGWTTVIRLPGYVLGDTTLAVLRRSGTRVAGGEVLRTALLTVLVTDTGQVLIGAAEPSVLEADR